MGMFGLVCYMCVLDIDYYFGIGEFGYCIIGVVSQFFGQEDVVIVDQD